MTNEKIKRTPNVKGGFLYTDRKKKKQLIITSISLFMVLVICLTGIILYNTQKSIYAVIAALAALPAAKMLVGYLIIMPYKSIKEDLKVKIEAVSGNMEFCEILYDVILSSTEKAMCAGVVYVKNGKVYGYTDFYLNNPKKKITLKDVEKHLKFILDANCNYSAIKMFDNEKKFLDMIKTETTIENTMNSDEKEKMKNMNERIAKQLKIYIF